MFIGRQLDGNIYGAWTSKQPNDQDHIGIEEVRDDHPDYLAFKNRVLPVTVDPILTLNAEIAALKERMTTVEKK